MSGEAGRLRLLGRPGCHLCDEMEAALRDEGLAAEAIRYLNVDADPALRARYGLRIPVLLDGDSVLCEGRIDRRRVRAWIEADR